MKEQSKHNEVTWFKDLSGKTIIELQKKKLTSRLAASCALGCEDSKKIIISQA